MTRRLMSFGVASSGGLSMDPAAIITVADRCLYRAKQSGRNQVVARSTAPVPELAGIVAGR